MEHCSKERVVLAPEFRGRLELNLSSARGLAGQDLALQQCPVNVFPLSGGGSE